MRRPSLIIMHNCNNCSDKDTASGRAGVLRRLSNGCGNGGVASTAGEEEEEEAREGSKGDEDDAASVHEVAATVMLPGHMLAALKPKAIIEKEQREALRRLKEERRRRRRQQQVNPAGGGHNNAGEDDSSAATTTAVTASANVFLRRLLPSCLAGRRSTLAELRDEEDSSLSHLDLVDEELGTVHRSIMARTRQKYLAMEASSFWDRSFTGGLIVLTAVAILVLFLYQNFGPGILKDHRY